MARACEPDTRRAPGVRTGVAEPIQQLAEETGWSASSLDAYRKVYLAYVNRAGSLVIMEGISHTAHRVAMGRWDRRDLLSGLAAQTGDPSKVTKKLVQEEIAARVDAETYAQNGPEKVDYLGDVVHAMTAARAYLVTAVDRIKVWARSGTLAGDDNLPVLVAGAEELVDLAERVRSGLVADASRKAIEPRKES